MSNWKTILGALAALFALNKGAKALGRKLGQTTYTTKKGQLGRPYERKETKD
jgi:hypothetical protein|tara:strand:+ start:118 stop:273 length:156 start_codon:yes stop_codon:yes gene_type:complete